MIIVQLSDCTIAPSIWLQTPSGLIAWPQSPAATTRPTVRAPVAGSTLSSRATAQ